MFFASDNGAPVHPAVLQALAALGGGAVGYGNDDTTRHAQAMIRDLFEAPEAVVHFVATGTAANALALACLCPPWAAVFCHEAAHVQMDECAAPEFFTHGAKLIGIPGDHGRITAESLTRVLGATGVHGVHGVQRGALTLTNLTEAGTLYTPGEIAALADIAHAHGVPVHLDGARFANALAATGATPAQMTWRAGVDALSFGGTKNGLMGAEAVVLFDPAKGWELELRRKRAGHLASKMRYLSGQFPPWLADGLWLTVATHANAKAARLAAGLAAIPGVRMLHPVQGNILFVEWPTGTHARLKAAGAVYYEWDAPPGREAARLVTHWNTTTAEVDGLLAAIA
ncbi:MAG: low specificity L-threonine aldolase [Paracoccaceae bacterium]|nr:MAG: low specificity L-threonine aldolase [Paracoccaceae bacterium]